MIYILLSILFNSLLFVIIKQFSKYKIDNLQALVVNYFVAGSLGIIINNQYISTTKLTSHNWFIGSVFLGFLFITVFYLTTTSAQKNGITVTTIASKMSVIIPIAFGVFLYGDPMGILKFIGTILALIAVYLASKKENIEKFDITKMSLPFLVFIGAGIIDTSIKYFQNSYVLTPDIPLFSINTFMSAFVAGLIIVTFRAFIGATKIKLKNIIGGVVLGIPNYFSLYYMIRMLNTKKLDSATIFTIHNISIVILSTLFAILFFNEKISRQNQFGIALAIVSLLMVTY